MGALLNRGNRTIRCVCVCDLLQAIGCYKHKPSLPVLCFLLSTYSASTASHARSFFKNGQSLGVAFRNVTEEMLFPCVGLRTRDEEVRVCM